MFYALGHFSKFIPENSNRIHLDIIEQVSNNKNISYVALDNEELRQTTFIILNRFDIFIFINK